jgi:hypothetical protein
MRHPQTVEQSSGTNVFCALRAAVFRYQIGSNSQYFSI